MMSDNVEALAEARKAAEAEAGNRWPYTSPSPYESLDFSQRDVDARAAEAFIEGALFEARRFPAPQQVSTDEELDALPVGSVMLDTFAAACVRASDSSGALDWRRVTTAVRGGEHRHRPYLPATVLYRPVTEGSESGE